MFKRFLLFLLASTSVGTMQGADGVVYYSRVPTLTSPATLHRINADGSGEQALPVNLPSPLYPTVSRDGNFLLMTSPDPGRPFKISNNVFVENLASGALGRVTGYEDVVQLQGVILTNDFGDPVGNRNISGYSVNFPYHKAFSPDGSRVVVMNFRKSGSVTRDTPTFPGGAGELTAGSGRIPVVEIFNVADGAPIGSYVYLGIERTGYNQGGDGVDWHPTRNEIIATLSSDIPATGTAGVRSMEGTVLVVFTATGPYQLVRKLTNPVGQWDAYADIFNFYSISAAQHDYAPAISRDGTRVAFVRHTLRTDSRFGLAPLPAQCSIRVINYDGTGEREVLRLTDGLWVTRVAWSPDGSQIAFDLAPQAVLNGWSSLLGDVNQSEVHIVNADGTNPRRLVQAPAAFPTWAPGGNINNPPAKPVLRAARNGKTLDLNLDQLTLGRSIRVERTFDLKSWTSVSNLTATATSQTLTIAPGDGERMEFFRIWIP